MNDWDSIWHQQEQAQTVIDANGLSVWDMHYNPERHAIEIELQQHLLESQIESIPMQFNRPADYDGEGENGSLLTLYIY